MVSDAPEPSPEVLDELLRAFGEPDPGSIDFDDPRIDEMLGLTPSRTDSSSDTDEPSGAESVASAAVEPAPTPTRIATPAPAPRIIVIAEDDQPDTEYLDAIDEERHGDAQRAEEASTTIVIGDVDDGVQAQYIDGTGERTTMEPRLRARRVEVRRAEGRKRLKIALAVGAVLVVLAAGFGVLASNAFAATEIDVIGATYTNRQALDAIVDDVRGTPLLLVDESEIEQRVAQIAWVESVRVSSDFPDRLVIDIRERSPLAYFYGTDGQVRVIDRDGRVLDVLDARPVAYGEIVGVGPDTVVGAFAGDAYATAAQYVEALPDEVRALLTSLAVDPATGDISLVLGEGIAVRLGDGSDKSGKLVRLLQQVRDGLEGIIAIDVTTESPSVTPG
jgi:cell division protein FtsQ